MPDPSAPAPGEIDVSGAQPLPAGSTGTADGAGPAAPGGASPFALPSGFTIGATGTATAPIQPSAAASSSTVPAVASPATGGGGAFALPQGFVVGAGPAAAPSSASANGSGAGDASGDALSAPPVSSAAPASSGDAAAQASGDYAPAALPTAPPNTSALMPPPSAAPVAVPNTAVSPEQITPQAAPAGGSYAGHVAGLGARAGLEGLVGLALGPAALAARGIDWATGSKALSSVANAPAWVDDRLTDLGLPQPQTAAERYGTAIAENVLPVLATGGLGAIGGVARAVDALPTAAQTLGRLLLTGGAPRTAQVLGGTGAGALQQYAADSGAGTKGQLLAAIIGAAAGGGVHSAGETIADYGARVGAPFTGGRPGLAGQAILSRSSDPGTFADRLATGTADQAAGTSPMRLPTSPATPGMLAGDQGMMAFEQGIRNTTTDNDAYRAFDQARSHAQVAAIRELADPATHSAPERGFTIRNAIEQAHDATNARTSQLYQAAAPAAGRLSVVPLMHHIQGEITGRFGPGSGGPPPELGALWHEIVSGPGLTHEASTLMRMSPRLGEMAGRLKMSGNRMGAQAAMRTRDAIEAIAGSPAWEQARRTRRSQGEAFGRNAEGTNAVGAIRAEDRFGSPTMQDDKVADRAIWDGAATRQIFHALERGLNDARASGAPAADIDRLEHNAADVMTAMREHFIDRLMRKGSVSRDDHGNETLSITPRQWQRYWADHAEVAANLFHPGERRLLDADFAEQQRFTDAGKANGSNTMKNAATARFMKGLAGGRIPGELRTARFLAAGFPIALAKGATVGLDFVHPGAGRGLEHAAHRAGEFYFLTRGGHGASHNVLAGIMNPGAHHVAEEVREAAGDPVAVRHLIDAVRTGKVRRIAAAVQPRPFRRRALDAVTRGVLSNSPALSQAQQGNERRAPGFRVAS